MKWFSRKTSIAGIQIPNWMHGSADKSTPVRGCHRKAFLTSETAAPTGRNQAKG